MTAYLGGELVADISKEIDDFELSKSFNLLANIAFSMIKDANISGNTTLYKNCIYPVMFLWRQSLELILKNLAKELGIQPKNPSKNSGHDILLYWETLKQETSNFKNIWPQQYDQVCLNEIDIFINQIGKLDPKSTAFRFSSNKDGSNPLQGVATLSYDDYCNKFIYTHSILTAITLKARVPSK